jgi:hypothetical protein
MEVVMKKALPLLLVVALLIGIPAVSSAGFATGVLVGSALSSSNSSSGEGPSSLLYEAPFVRERIKNPLVVRMVSVCYYESDKKSIYEIFCQALGRDNPQKYEILQVVRAIDGSSPTRAGIWFLYTEKGNLYPVDDFPGKKKAAK